MGYKDPERRRQYNRERMRTRRAGGRATPGATPLPSGFRLKTAQDALELLAEQVSLIRNDADVGTVEGARAIGYLVGVALKAIEFGDLAARIEALEKGPSYEPTPSY